MLPFGFAIGDFVAVGTLAMTVMRVVKETGSASRTYASLIALLQSLFTLVGEISSFLASSPPVVQARLNPSTLNALRHHLESCQHLMLQFLVSGKANVDFVGLS